MSSKKTKPWGVGVVLILVALLFTSLGSAQEFTTFTTLHNVNLCSCSTQSYDMLTLENPSTTTKDYVISFQGSAAQWAASSERIVTLGPKKNKTVDLFLHSPCATTGTHDLSVVVNDGERARTIKQTIAIHPCKGVGLTSPKTIYSAIPCTPTVIPFTLINPSTRIETYDLKVLGIDPSLVTFSEQSVVLNPKDSMEGFAYFRNSCDAYGRYDFSLLAASRQTDAGSTLALSVDVAPAYFFGISAGEYRYNQGFALFKDTPNHYSVCEGGIRTIPFEVENLVGIPNAYALQTNGPSWAQPIQPSLSLPSNAAAAVDVVVTPPVGTQGTFALTVAGTSQRGGINIEETITLNVEQCYALTADIPDEITVCEGEADIPVTIINNGRFDHDIILTTEGSGCILPEQNHLAISALGQTTTRLVSAVDCQETGTKQLVLRAQALGLPDVQAVDVAKVNIVPFASCYDATVSNYDVVLNSEQGLILTNTGAKAITYTLRSPAWMSFAPDQVTLQPGEQISVPANLATDLAPGFYEAQIEIIADDKAVHDKTIMVQVGTPGVGAYLQRYLLWVLLGVGIFILLVGGVIALVFYLAEKENTAEHTWESVKRRETISMKLPEGMGFTEVQCTINTAAENVTLRVEKVHSTPNEETLNFTCYKRANITLQELTNGDLDKVILKCKVSKTWLEEKGAKPTDIRIARSDGLWEVLKPKQMGSDESFVYFKQESKGLSYWIIGIEKKEEEEEQAAQEEAAALAATAKEATDAKDKEEKGDGASEQQTKEEAEQGEKAETKKKKRSIIPYVIIIALLAILGCAAYFTKPYWAGWWALAKANLALSIALAVGVLILLMIIIVILIKRYKRNAKSTEQEDGQEELEPEAAAVFEKEVEAALQRELEEEKQQRAGKQKGKREAKEQANRYFWRLFLAYLLLLLGIGAFIWWSPHATGYKETIMNNLIPIASIVASTIVLFLLVGLIIRMVRKRKERKAQEAKEQEKQNRKKGKKQRGKKATSRAAAQKKAAAESEQKPKRRGFWAIVGMLLLLTLLGAAAYAISTYASAEVFKWVMLFVGFIGIILLLFMAVSSYRRYALAKKELQEKQEKSIAKALRRVHLDEKQDDTVRHALGDKQAQKEQSQHQSTQEHILEAEPEPEERKHKGLVIVTIIFVTIMMILGLAYFTKALALTGLFLYATWALMGIIGIVGLILLISELRGRKKREAHVSSLGTTTTTLKKTESPVKHEEKVALSAETLRVEQPHKEKRPTMSAEQKRMRREKSIRMLLLVGLLLGIGLTAYVLWPSLAEGWQNATFETIDYILFAVWGIIVIVLIMNIIQLRVLHRSLEEQMAKQEKTTLVTTMGDEVAQAETELADNEPVPLDEEQENDESEQNNDGSENPQEEATAEPKEQENELEADQDALLQEEREEKEEQEAQEKSEEQPEQAEESTSDTKKV